MYGALSMARYHPPNHPPTLERVAPSEIQPVIVMGGCEEINVNWTGCMDRNQLDLERNQLDDQLGLGAQATRRNRCIGAAYCITIGTQVG